MEMAENSTSTNISSFGSLPSANSTPSESKVGKKRKPKRKSKPDGSKVARIAPDLDIVSGFAFLSFSSLEDLEHHIEETEAKSRSLSINVGQKRKIQPKNVEEKGEVVRSVSKRVKIPSQKILESYVTKDVPINQLVASQDLHGKQTVKVKISPESKSTSSCLNSLNVNKSHYSESTYRFPDKIHVEDDDDLSLECSETLDACMFDDEDVKPILKLDNNANIEKCLEKKHKKKKKKKVISDTSCQTMFRIKKKKKKPVENVQLSKPETTATTDNSEIDVVNVEDVVIIEENSQSDLTSDFEKAVDIVTVDVPGVADDDIRDLTAKEKYKQLQATKFFDSRYLKPKISNKVEKIDYCARSGGVNLVERHHQRQAKLKDDFDSVSMTSCNQQFPPEDDDDDDASSISDNSNSGNECNNAPVDQEGLLCDKTRIFAGSSSVFLSTEELPNDSEIDIGDDFEESSHSPINIVKALPKNYLFGHFSTYPDKSTDGTVDVSIQIYDNDIQLYMNYASDFNGKIIKIITPDNEETSKNGNSCIPNCSSMSSVPKFLQPQEYVKAIRSATERNRRHTLGDLFNHLKNEIFGDVREFYFSKQSILSKALEVISSEDQQHYELNKEKAKLSAKNQLLRTSLNKLLFGETTECSKKVDVDKVTNYLKTINIKIQMPSKDVSKEEADKSDKGTQEQGDAVKYVSKKGRPPLGGKLFMPRNSPTPKTVLPSKPVPTPVGNIDKEPEQNTANKGHQLLEGKSFFVPVKPSQTSTDVPNPNNLSSNAMKNKIVWSKVKEFVAIAPRSTENKASTDEQESKDLNIAINNKVKEFVTIAPGCTENKVSIDDQESKDLNIAINNKVKEFVAIAPRCTERRTSSDDEESNLNAAINNKIKEFVAIAPRGTERKITTNESEKQDVTNTDKVVISEPRLTSDTPLGKIVCNLSNITGMKLITNPVEPLKAIESKNVVHIKIANDTMKQMNNTRNPASSTTIENKGLKTTIKPSQELSKNVFAPQTKSMSTQSGTQTSPTDMQTSTDQTSLKPQQQATIANAASFEGKQYLLAKPSVTGANTTLLTLKPTDSLKRLVSILKEKGSVQRLVVNSSTATNRPSAAIAAANPQHSTETSSVSGPSPIVQAQALPSPSSSGIQTMTTVQQKANSVPVPSNLTIGKSSTLTPMAAQGIVGVTGQSNATMTTQRCGTTTQGSVSMATQCSLPATTQGYVTMASQGCVTMPTQGSVAVTPRPNIATTKYTTGTSQTYVNVCETYMKVLPQPSTGVVPQGQMNTVPNNTQPIRIIFKPTGKPINTPADQVKGVMQSQRLLRLPIANANLLPQSSTAAPTNLQAPNIRFLLQKQPSQHTVQQAGSGVHIQNIPPAMAPSKGKQLVYIKPLVKTQQPQQSTPQNPTKLLPAACTTSSVSTLSTSVHQGLAIASTKPTTLNVSSAVKSIPNSLCSQIPGNSTQSASHVTKLCALSANSSHPLILPQPDRQQAPVFQHQANPNTAVQTPTTAINAESKKTIFSGMEEMVAKIPSPLSSPLQQQNVPNLQNTFVNKQLSPLKATVTLQRLTKDAIRMPIKVTSNLPSNQITAGCPSTKNKGSLQGMSQAKPLCLENVTSSCQSNIPSATVQSVSPSNDCSSSVVGAQFQFSAPKPDKTCSVVENTAVDNSNVVTADTLSTWNIDSSIPDITSELQGGQDNSSLNALSSYTPSQDMSNPGIHQNTQKDNCVGKDDNANEDFDLLAASLEAPGQCF